MSAQQGNDERDLYFREFRRNQFSCFYNEKPKKSEAFGRKIESVSQEELSKYTHAEAITFAAKSWKWKKSSDKRLPRRSDNDVPTFQFQKGNRAYYRVLVEKEGKYILIACHANVHGFHRGDLRFVEVNDKTITRGLEKYSVIGKLFLGDVVAVTELAKKTDGSLENPPRVSRVHQDYDCTWEIRNMTVLPRKIDDKVNFAILEDGIAIAEGHKETMHVTEDVSKPLQMEQMYIGTAFIPEKIEINFTEDFNREHKNKLIELSSDLSSYPNSLGTIYSYVFCENQTRLFHIGVKAFDSETFLSNQKESDEIVEKCVRMGASAAHITSNGRFDGRGFPIRDVCREGLLVRFTIPNPKIQPTEGRWTSNQRITLDGKDGKFDAIIETVVLDNKHKQNIAARLPRNTPSGISFKNDVWIVYQQPFPEIPKLQKGFFKGLHKNCNGRRVIETLYGGKKIDESVIMDHDERFQFPSDPQVVLNKYQSYYVSMIHADEPLVLGNSPFGCGKSMTIVTAALEVHKRNARFNAHGKQKQQLLVTQSNNAGVSLIDIALRIKESRAKFLRYISETNWNLLPDASRTVLDMPHLMRGLFVKWATRSLVRIGEFDCLTSDMKNAIVRQLIQKYLPSTDLEGEARLIYENMDKEKLLDPPSPRILRSAFFVLYQPDIIVTTADSLQGLLSADVLKYISNLQIDEASQLPEHTLIQLLQTFPFSGFGLVGDIKQLPPHCEKNLKGRLKDYGVGNTMERALQSSMFPQSSLRYVYRCHPVTTQTLSDLFYDGKLLLGVTNNDRNEFMRCRQDLWPNFKFPILVLNHTDKGHRVGFSVANESEKMHVQRIVEFLTRKIGEYELKESDVGVISFYRAQTSLLTEAFRGTNVKCGTIDAFQGTEREVMIVCCTNDKPSDFMKLGNRLNVAMSRARQATIIIGNVAGLRGVKYWDTIVRKADRNSCLIKEIFDFGPSDRHMLSSCESSIDNDISDDDDDEDTSDSDDDDDDDDDTSDSDNDGDDTSDSDDDDNYSKNDKKKSKDASDEENEENCYPGEKRRNFGIKDHNAPKRDNGNYQNQNSRMRRRGRRNQANPTIGQPRTRTQQRRDCRQRALTREAKQQESVILQNENKTSPKPLQRRRRSQKAAGQQQTNQQAQVQPCLSDVEVKKRRKRPNGRQRQALRDKLQENQKQIQGGAKNVAPVVAPPQNRANRTHRGSQLSHNL